MSGSQEVPSAVDDSAVERASRQAAGERLLAAGIDGARGGWVAAACFGESAGTAAPAGRTELAFHAADDDNNALQAFAAWMLERSGGEPVPTAVDVPIGLNELGGARPCDRQARGLLRGRASTVFNPPGRYVLDALDPAQDTDYAAVRSAVERQRERERRAAAAEGRAEREVIGLGAQSAGLLAKVREANAYVRASGWDGPGFAAERCLFEVHPELCFQRMRALALGAGGDPVMVRGSEHALAPKTSARGTLQRLALLRLHFPDVEAAIASLDWPQRHGLDDVLDAYAALWTALRWARDDPDLMQLYGEERAEPVREDGAGERGLLMRIVV